MVGFVRHSHPVFLLENRAWRLGPFEPLPDPVTVVRVELQQQRLQSAIRLNGGITDNIRHVLRVTDQPERDIIIPGHHSCRFQPQAEVLLSTAQLGFGLPVTLFAGAQGGGGIPETHDSPDPRQKFSYVQWFDQVIIRARFQAIHLVGNAGGRAGNQDNENVRQSWRRP